MTSKSPDSAEEEAGPPRMMSRSEESEASFWRLKRSSDEWRENRVKRVLAQEEESLFTTLGRMSFLTICILFDGVFLYKFQSHSVSPSRHGLFTSCCFTE
jgi:hypothetical protein